MVPPAPAEAPASDVPLDQIRPPPPARAPASPKGRVGLLLGAGLLFCGLALQVSAPPPALSKPPLPPLERLPFAKLSDFEYEMPPPGEKAREGQIPAAVLALSGKHVQLDGYMLPVDLDQEGTGRFLLMKDLHSCNFGADATMNSWAFVVLPEGQKARYLPERPVTARGILEVGEKYDSTGELMSIYRLLALEVGARKES